VKPPGLAPVYLGGPYSEEAAKQYEDRLIKQYQRGENEDEALDK
jgi:hypothetical protein